MCCIICSPRIQQIDRNSRLFHVIPQVSHLATQESEEIITVTIVHIYLKVGSCYAIYSTLKTKTIIVTKSECTVPVCHCRNKIMNSILMI